jgi:predicted PurR-regulated permease PerM
MSEHGWNVTTAGSDIIRNRLLAGILILLVIAGLRASYSVTMPLAAASVALAAIWPLKPWLDQVLPSKVSYCVVILALLLLPAAFFGAIYFSVEQVVRAFVQNQEQFSGIFRSISAWTAQWGVQEPGVLEGYSRAISFGQSLLSNAYAILGYLGFITILVILGVFELPSLSERLHGALDAVGRKELVFTVNEIGDQIRRYLRVTAATSAITGCASALWAFSIGLDLALVWGVLNFLLNFIPMVGNIIGIVPPTLYAMIQFQSFWWTIVVFFGFAVLQLAISNVVYPMLQGRSLSISPIVILASLALWGWLWGVAGVLLAVPITAALVIVCERFSSTEWIARLLSSRKDGATDRA